MVTWRIKLRCGWDRKDAYFVAVVRADTQDEAIREATKQYMEHHKPTEVHVEIER